MSNPIEEEFSENEYLEQICIAGLGCSQHIALANLSEIGLAATPKEVESSLMNQLQKVNASQEAYSKISTVIISKDTWSESNGLLTPTLKVRRGAIDDRYSGRFVTWHEMKENIIWER